MHAPSSVGHFPLVKDVPLFVGLVGLDFNLKSSDLFSYRVSLSHYYNSVIFASLQLLPIVLCFLQTHPLVPPSFQ